MRFRGLALASLAACILSCSASSTSLLGAIPGLDTSSLARTYTGVLQEAAAAPGMAKPYVNLAEVVTVTQPNPAQLTFSSNAFPSFTAVVVSTGQTAIDLNLVGITGNGVMVQEVAFAKDSSGNWVLVIQTATAGDASSTIVQFASYDPANAPPATAVEAVDYLVQMFKLAGKAGG